MPKEKQAQFAQQYMMNAQRAQTMQRGNNAMYGNMQYYRPVQMMQPYQQGPQMGFSPFSNGFNFSPFGMMPGMPFAPTMSYQPYPQMQPPRPMVAQAYPSPGAVMPPPVVYQPQYQANNQSRPLLNPQPMMQAPMNPPMNPATLLQNHGVNMNLNPSNMNLGVRPGHPSQNRGWWYLYRMINLYSSEQ